MNRKTRVHNVLDRRTRRAIICYLGLVLIVLPATVLAQNDQVRYFEETGHNVSGEFLRYYDQYGGQALFGYPITRRFTADGRDVQYFQRVRFELYPDNPSETRVRLGPLAAELGYGQPPIPPSEVPPADHPDKRYFGETGHTLAFAFLDFHRSMGGEQILGYPLTEWIIEPNGQIVQYLQCARLEWRPEMPNGQRVQLGELGTIYVEQRVDPIYKEREDPQHMADPVPSETAATEPLIAPGVTALQTLVTVKSPIISLNTEQTVYVYVLDQEQHGVPGASVEMELDYRNGQADRFVLDATNANGYTQYSWKITAPVPGYVAVVRLHARYGELVTQTSTAFLPWW